MVGTLAMLAPWLIGAAAGGGAAATAATVGRSGGGPKTLGGAAAPSPTSVRPVPADAEYVGKAVRRDQVGKGSATVPMPGSIPDPASVGTGDINTAVAKARKRAAAGNAGKVTTGVPSLLQQAIQAVLTPRTLIGG